MNSLRGGGRFFFTRSLALGEDAEMSESGGQAIPFPNKRPENDLAGQLERLSIRSLDQIVDLYRLAETEGVEVPSLVRFMGQLFTDPIIEGSLRAATEPDTVVPLFNDEDAETAERLEAGLQPGASDVGLLDWADDQVEELSRLEDVVGGLKVLPLALANVRLIDKFVRPNESPARIERLWIQKYAEAARLTGWAAHDGRNRSLSKRYLTEAMKASESIDNQNFASYCQAMLGFEAVDNGEPLVALAHLEAAQSRCSKDSPFQVVLEQWRVQPLGMLGLHRQAIQSLVKADRLWEAHSPDQVPTWAYWIMRPSHTPEVPRGFIEADPNLAERLLTGGLNNLSSDWPRDKFLFQIGIAECLAVQGEFDRLASITGDVIENGGVTVARVAERVRSLVAALPDGSHSEELVSKIQETT